MHIERSVTLPLGQVNGSQAAVLSDSFVCLTAGHLSFGSLAQDLTFQGFCDKILLKRSPMVMNANHLFMATDLDIKQVQDASNVSCLGDVLTDTQREWLVTYRREHAGKLIFDLSQNPGEDGRPRCSLADGAAPCFTTNSGRLWFSQQELN